MNSPEESLIKLARHTLCSGICIGTFFLISCQGPVGSDGSDAKLSDSLPPEIEWITPAPNDTVDGDVILSVHARDDEGILRVGFFIAGFEFPGTLSDSAGGIYTYAWQSESYPEAPYPLQAKVWDTSRLVGTTPVRIVHLRR